MTNSRTINFHINRFCTCDGCIKKINSALREVGGVKLLEMDPETGSLTVSTAKPAELIQFALKKKLKQSVSIAQEVSPPNALADSNNTQNLIIRQTTSSQVTPLGSNDINEMAKALVTASHAKGLQSVEYTQSTTYKFNFANNENQPSTSRLPSTINRVKGSNNGVHLEELNYEESPPLPPPPPPQTIQPSAPPLPTTNGQVYGSHYDQRYVIGQSSKNNPPQGFCTIL